MLEEAMRLYQENRDKTPFSELDDDSQRQVLQIAINLEFINNSLTKVASNGGCSQ